MNFSQESNARKRGAKRPDQSRLNHVLFTAFFLFALSEVPFSAQAQPTEATQPLAEAQAWQVEVKEIRDFPEISGRPSLSHDSRQIAYVALLKGTAPNDGSAQRPKLRLVVRRLEDWKTTKLIPLPEDTVIMGSLTPDRTVAWSPDDRKIALGSDSCETSMLFVTLESQKITPVRFQPGVGSVARLLWANATNVFIEGLWTSSVLDLETLTVTEYSSKVQQIPKEMSLTEYEERNKISNHKNCVLEVRSYAFSGLEGPKSLVIHSRKQTFSKILLPRVIDGDGLTFDDWIFWTPDLKYIVFHRHLFGEEPVKLAVLGTRASATLDFKIAGTGTSLSAENLQLLKRVFTKGNRIWATVFEPRVNPLNDKLLGPDEDKPKGWGYLTQVEPGLSFRYSFEYHAATSGNIVSRFFVDKTLEWDADVWAELRAMEKDDAIKLANLEKTLAEYEVAVRARAKPEDEKNTSKKAVEPQSYDQARSEIVQLLEKAIVAKGGRDTLSRFRVCRTVFTSTGTLNGKSYRMRVTESVELPDKLRVDQEVSFGGKQPAAETLYILGSRSLVLAKPGAGSLRKKMTPESEAGLRESLYLSECTSLVPLLSSDYELEMVSTPAIQQEHAVAIRVRKARKPDVTLLFDPDTAVLIGVDTSRGSARFSGFREFSGLRAPAISKYSESNVESTSTIEKIEALDSFPDPPTQ